MLGSSRPVLICSSSHWPSELKIKLVLLKSELSQSEQSADRGSPSAWKPGLVLQCLIWRRPLKAFRSQTQVLLEKIAAVSFMCRSHLDQIKASSSRLFSDVAMFAFSQSGDDITVLLLLWFSWEFFLFFSCLSLILCCWTLFEVLMFLHTIIMFKYNTSGDFFFWRGELHMLLLSHKFDVLCFLDTLFLPAYGRFRLLM